MLQKMWHKKWMNLSLLLGVILLAATVVSFPLYQRAAYDRMLTDEFNNYLSSEGDYPAMAEFTIVCKRDKGGKTLNRMEEYMKKVYSDLGVDPKLTIYSYSLLQSTFVSQMNRSDASPCTLVLGGMSDFESHIRLIAGEMYSEEGIDEEGRIEVMVSQECMVQRGFLVGETIEAEHLKMPDGSPIRLLIKGVYETVDTGDFYWQVGKSVINSTAYCPFDCFYDLFTGENAEKYSVSAKYYPLFEYETITSDKVDKILAGTDYLLNKSAYKSVVKVHSYQSILENYKIKVNRISATLIILEVPVLVMLAAFLLMISGQMYEMEKNEISVIKSRGSSSGQIFRLYLYQGLLLTFSGSAVGVPLGTVFARLLGSARNFLEFDTSEELKLSFTNTVWMYLAAGMLVTLLCITIPAIKHSKVTIVNLKQQKAVRKKSWWQKLFLDVILLGVSLYGYYSFHKNMTNLSGDVLSGESLDPLLYVSSSVFIVGAGLLFLRLQPYLIRLIKLIAGRKVSPAGYISFMENVKNISKQQLIMLFLIMTVSLGMFHSTVARTILQNAINNTEYKDGADVILMENWVPILDTNGAFTGEYKEPDYSRFATMEFADKYTKVYYDKQAYVKQDKNGRVDAVLMGINTKEFGEITSVDTDYLEKHYYHYLNALAENEKGLLVSRTFETVGGMKVGDTLTFYNQNSEPESGVIVDFIDYFPGFAPTVTGLNPDGSAYTKENYLIVTHLDKLKNAWGVNPYEVWISLKDGYEHKDVYDWIENHNISLKKYVNKANDVEQTMSDPLLQGTNGILTMGFVVTLILCGVGYLIYWIMSIKERELIFGVLRACGFHRSEVFHMLINEQIFSGLFSILAGIGIGFLTGKMFVPILQTSYASSDQMLPMKLITNTSDLYRLYGIIGGMMITCIVVLVVLLFRMNVTKALKLGEE